MKRSTLVLVVALALVGVVAAIAASLLHDGLSARSTPNKLEITIARNARHLAIPSAARQAQNPLLASPEDLRDARLHFADHCTICHAAFSNGGEHGGTSDSWKLVHFIRHLPHLTAAERIEMERYNPKGPDDRAEEQQENEFLNGATPQRKPESKKHSQE